jgi:hypothetical protein
VEAIVQDPTLDSGQKSESLARVGEKLSTPSGFMYAEEVLDLALSYDKTNFRAQFYKKLNAPVVALKGAMARLTPAAKKFSPQVQRDFLQARREFAINPSIDRFFNVGPKDIVNESQVQALVDQVLAKQDGLRTFLRDSKGLAMDLHSVVPVGEITDIWMHCPVTANGPVGGKYHKTYSAKNCRELHNTEAVIDIGDLEVLQHIAAGMEMYSIVVTSYDLTGAAAIETSFSNPRVNLSMPQQIAALQSHKKLGQIRNAKALKMIQSLGSDMYAGATWAQSLQDRLCPAGWEAQNRPGMLFDKGICVQDYPGQKRGSLDTAFHVIATSLAGQTVSVFTRDGAVNVTEMADSTEGGKYFTNANILAPIMNPIDDLKRILPTQFDKCGRANNLGDSTAAGLFPRGDAQEVAKSLELIYDKCDQN